MNSAPLPFSLRQLQYLVAVAEKKNFRLAAEECHVAQPSLSAQIALVEEALGLKIFERNSKSVTVTAPGEKMIARARELLMMAHELSSAANVLADPFGATLRIGMIPTVAPYLLPEAAPFLRKTFPKMQFVWSEDKTATVVEKIERLELDAAVVALESDLGSLRHSLLGKDAFVFASPKGHELSHSKSPIKTEDLDHQTILLLDDGHCFRDQALSFCSKSNLQESKYRATSLGTLVQMAAGGAGVTLLPAISLKVENRRHTLNIRTFAKKSPERTLVWAWRKNSSLEATIKAVGKALRSFYGEEMMRLHP